MKRTYSGRRRPNGQRRGENGMRVAVKLMLGGVTVLWLVIMAYFGPSILGSGHKHVDDAGDGGRDQGTPLSRGPATEAERIGREKKGEQLRRRRNERLEAEKSRQNRAAAPGAAAPGAAVAKEQGPLAPVNNAPAPGFVPQEAPKPAPGRDAGDELDASEAVKLAAKVANDEKAAEAAAIILAETATAQKAAAAAEAERAAQEKAAAAAAAAKAEAAAAAVEKTAREKAAASAAAVQALNASNAAKPAEPGVLPVVPPKEAEPEWDYQYRMDPSKMVDAVAWRDDVFSVTREECDRVDDDRRLLDRIEVWGASEKAGPESESPRIFCAVYTYHKNYDTQMKAIRETWASRCDGFVGYSDVDDQSVPVIGLQHEGIEEYSNIWQKVRSLWKYTHHWYRDDFDWFMIGGDDIFIILENLRRYLLSEEIVAASENGEKPLFLGRRFTLGSGEIFNSGGAGYVLNRAALDFLAAHLDDPVCRPHLHTSAEDVQVADCLRLAGAIYPYDTRDSLGRERFHPFMPGHHLTYRIAPNDWYTKYSPYLKEGYDCCSPESISFHYVKSDLMYRVFNLVYSCPKKVSAAFKR